MEFDKNEMLLFKYLVQRELDELKKLEKEIVPSIPELALEEKYEIFLQNLLKKLQ